MFNLNRHYDHLENRPPIQIKHVHSSVSYQQATYQIYNRRGQESSSGYGPLGRFKLLQMLFVELSMIQVGKSQC